MVSVDSQAMVEREEKRFTVTGTPELRLTTFDGAIEIRSWDRPDVLVEIEKRGADEGGGRRADRRRPSRTATGSGRGEASRAETFSGFGFHHSASAKLIVTVPRDDNVTARSGDGSIRIERVTGSSSSGPATAASAPSTSTAS